VHPEIAKTLIAQHRDELVRHTTSGRRTGRRRFPRWHVSAGHAGRRGSSLVIIISAHRSA
jgi:hypothetical protein